MSAKKQIRVVLAASQAVVRNHLNQLLLSCEGLQLVGEAVDGEEAFQLCELVQPDLIFIELHLPERGGIETTKIILRRWSHMKVIVLASPEDENLVGSALDVGASGSISHIMSPEQVQQVILEVCGSGQESPKRFNTTLSPNQFSESQLHLSRELAEAARVQASFMPVSAPSIPGWDLSARLVPARETSGDFFDFIPLPNGNLGIVIADVTDKGMGAALFMAMASTLIRTYASLYPTLPAFAMGVVNERIQADTGGSMHVTAFYGVLEPDTGRLSYVNAGHNPPYVLSSRKGKPFDRLKATGTPLGVSEKNYLQQKVIKLSPVDMLLLYTDGIVEARNPAGSYFGDQRLFATARSSGSRSAREVQEAVFAEVYKFLGGASVEDDMALMVVSRKG
ncbi:MAG: SpoIIE family protein phosphatase [Anaerolineales bacterium]|nr:MAG: SpoIIE family protein phosphatase [Anaerolineales bacterium]